MEDMVEITIDVNKDFWKKLKQLSNDLKDSALLDFLFQTGEYILETIKRKSIIIEVNGETKRQEVIEFDNLLDQYGLDELDDFIKKAKPDDFI